MLGSLIVAQLYHIMLSRCLAEHLELWGRGKAGGMDEGHLPLCPQQPSGKVLEKGVCQSEETTLANVWSHRKRLGQETEKLEMEDEGK